MDANAIAIYSILGIDSSHIGTATPTFITPPLPTTSPLHDKAATTSANNTASLAAVGVAGLSSVRVSNLLTSLSTATNNLLFQEVPSNNIAAASNTSVEKESIADRPTGVSSTVQATSEATTTGFGGLTLKKLSLFSSTSLEAIKKNVAATVASVASSVNTDSVPTSANQSTNKEGFIVVGGKNESSQVIDKQSAFVIDDDEDDDEDDVSNRQHQQPSSSSGITLISTMLYEFIDPFLT